MKPPLTKSCLVLLLLPLASCGENDLEHYEPGPCPPSSVLHASDSPDEVAEVLWDLLEQRGERNGDQLTTVIRYPEDEREQLLTLGKINIKLTPLELTAPQELNGWQWRCRVELGFSAERLVDAATGKFADWRNPKFTLLRMDYKTEEDGSAFTETIVGRRSGHPANLWDVRLLSNEHGFWFVPISSGWVDVRQDEAHWANILDSRLSHCQHPDTDARTRAARFAIRNVLFNDSRNSSAAEEKTAVRLKISRDKVEVPDKKEDYIPLLRATDVSACPPDFAEAFKRHVAAWEAGDKGAVESTWQTVEGAARRHRVGTISRLYLTRTMKYE